MGDGTEFIASEIGLVKCPKCGEDMVELIQEDMTDGQQADYDAGFNRPFQCSECGYDGLFDIDVQDEWEDEEIDELVQITRIDPNSFEEVIERALERKCFIEAISLMHNVIEAYLKRRIEDATSPDKARLQLIKEKFKPQYLHDYNTICYILGIIDKEKYIKVKDFNKKRNEIIHELLRKSITFEELRKIARCSRQIQMELSPLNHSKEAIKGIIKHFDEITEGD